MQRKDFILEIGTEEIPAGYIKPAAVKIETFFNDQLQINKLTFTSIQVLSTPRRFTLQVRNLQTEQKSETIERIGPAKKAAFDESGNLTKAGMGFLRGAGASEKDIIFVPSDKGEKIAVKINKIGKKTIDIMQNLISEIITQIRFPKSMKWGSGQLTFARPVRWLMVLFGDEKIELEIHGLTTGNTSYGNRFMQLVNPITIPKIDEYENKLKEVFVIPDRQKRKEMIQAQTEELFVGTDEQIIKDEKLTEIVTDLVEYPTAVIAEFDKKYMNLPEKVITSTLSQHQKYFSVETKEKKLTNKFVFISNGNPKNSGVIRKGNEKVIKARLEDAAFYFEEDTKEKLESYIPKLKTVVFQEKLGTLFDKTQRVIKLTEFLADSVSPEKKQTAMRAAELCKTDLVTLMLGEKELTKLQGYIGKFYAEKSGEEQGVCNAIYEHYLPRGENDDLPETIEGALTALADKTDTVCGIIGVGMLPTGSRDPFALRRAANGIVQIADKFSFEIDTDVLAERAFEILGVKADSKHLDFVKDFFKQRINYLLKTKNIDYDVIESVMHIQDSSVTDFVERTGALQKYKSSDSFRKLIIGFSRVSNIIAEVKEFAVLNAQLLKTTEEQILYKKYQILTGIVDVLLKNQDYEKIMDELEVFGVFIDKFFDEVLVNTEDEGLKQNRYSLLNIIREMFLKVADLAKIVSDK